MAPKVTSRTLLALLLIAAGAYVLVEPFAVSPATCMRSWPFNLLQSLGACATFADVAVAFWTGLAVAAILLVAGLRELLVESNSFRSQDGAGGATPSALQLGRRTVPGVIVAVILLVGVGATAATLIMRASQPTEQANVAQQSTDAEAEAVLQHSLPQIRDLSAGLTRSKLTISAPPPGNLPRLVDVFYSLAGRNYVQLTVWRGGVGTTDATETTTTLGGHVTYVLQHVVGDGTTDVAYTWEFDGLGHILHVRLVGGLSRADADRIAASVR